jgi:hypothetical protein
MRPDGGGRWIPGGYEGRGREGSGEGRVRRRTTLLPMIRRWGDATSASPVQESEEQGQTARSGY